MMAILRYAFLKNLRDGSLAAFILGPIIMLTAPLLGSAFFGEGGPRFPAKMDMTMSAARNAAMLAPATLFITALFASLAGFWSLRSEIISKSMGTFVLAVRPVKIQIAAMLFGAGAAFAGYIGTALSLSALLNALPPNPVRLILDAAILCLFGAAAGFLAVILSAEPWAIVPLFVAGVAIIPSLAKMRGPLPELTAIALIVICISISAFFLERRCAT
jgi:hypothetical protein